MNPMVLLFAGLGVYLLTRKKTAVATITPNQAEKWVINFFESKGEDGQVFVSMTDAEILDCYYYLHDFITPGLQLPPSNPLYARIQAISSKYNVFT